ncbi:MAG: hypothetical protein CM1200mP34_1110 [Verrucomicrobiales bacterium]|nr:MAG: hypothetical protein CM1200mP34_1110 [Verrucomicrobiales bacterium]
MTRRLAKLTLIAATLAGLAKPTGAPTEPVAVGMEGSLFIVLPGEPLKAEPVGDKSTIILRIQDTFPHGNDHRYDLRYFGFVPASTTWPSFSATPTVPSRRISHRSRYAFTASCRRITTAC